MTAEDGGTEGAGAAVLVVEDELPVRRFLRASLEGHGFRVLEAGTVKEGIALAAEYAPEVVLLDLGLPDGDGMEVARRLREWTQVPILVLSARGGEGQKVAALDAGADDYLVKPFGVPELLARIRVALRHARRSREGAEESVFAAGDLRVDLAARRVLLRGEPVPLTPIEYRMLQTLVKHAGRVVTHRQMLLEVWGPHSVEQTQYLRVHMAHLRRKLEDDAARPRFIGTEAGVGYRLVEGGAAEGRDAKGRDVTK